MLAVIGSQSISRDEKTSSEFIQRWRHFALSKRITKNVSLTFEKAVKKVSNLESLFAMKIVIKNNSWSIGLIMFLKSTTILFPPMSHAMNKPVNQKALA